MASFKIKKAAASKKHSNITQIGNLFWIISLSLSLSSLDVPSLHKFTSCLQVVFFWSLPLSQNRCRKQCETESLPVVTSMTVLSKRFDVAQCREHEFPVE